MTTETVKYVIEADDRATPVWRNFQSTVSSSGKQMGEVAKQAKLTSQGFVLLASSVGHVIPGLDGITSAAVALHGTLGKVQGASKAAGIALGLLKVGGVVALTVAVYEGVTALAKWIGGWDKLDSRLKQSEQALIDTKARLEELNDIKLDKAIKQLELLSPEGRQNALERMIREYSARDDEASVARARKLIDIRDNESLAAQVALRREERAEQEKTVAVYEDTKRALEDEIGILRLGADEYKKRQQLKAGLASGGEFGRDQVAALISERDALAKQNQLRIEQEEKIKSLKQEQLEAAKNLLRTQLDGTQTAKSALTSLKEQLIALREGKEAARAFGLQQEGIEGGTASQIARLEEELRKSQGLREGVRTNTASESRLLTGRVEMDAAKQTANATNRIRELTEKIWKQNEQMLAKQTEIAKNTETQLETLR